MRQSAKKITRLIPVMLLLFLFTGCEIEQPPPIKMPLHILFLESNTCSLPCWNNIIPGKTTRDEGISILNNLETVKPGSIYNDLPSEYHIYEKIFWEMTGVSGSLYVLDHRVIFIDFHLLMNTNNYTMFDYVGQPDYVWLGRSAGECAGAWGIYSISTKIGFVTAGGTCFPENIFEIRRLEAERCEYLTLFSPDGLLLVAKQFVDSDIETEKEFLGRLTPWEEYLEKRK